MKKILLIILILLVLLGLFVLKTVYQSGAFKTITNSFSGTTQRIEGLAGVEDIAIDQATGITFLSSDDRWASSLHKQPLKGAIYLLDLNDTLIRPKRLTDDLPQEDFHPHGISLFTTPEGKKILFVVNHRSIGNFIERFEYKNDSLLHRESISDPLIISPNDVVGVGERSFYFTNDHNEKLSGLRGIKDLLFIGTGNVCYYDGQKVVETAVNGLKYANGINTSPDGNLLYVAATSARQIRICNRDKATGTLTALTVLDANTGVDNIEVDDAGNLWVGCHPQLLKFLSHAKDESALSPSEIIKLTQRSNGSWEQKTVYMNDGSEVSASSVGAVYKNKLLIGPVFQRSMVVAEMQ